jgi:hypothetical protein
MVEMVEPQEIRGILERLEIREVAAGGVLVAVLEYGTLALDVGVRLLH